MKLRNKKTGEVVDFIGVYDVRNLDTIPHTNRFELDIRRYSNGYDGEKESIEYLSLEELTREWEDYQEKGCWCIEFDGDIFNAENLMEDTKYRMRAIGNCFDTKEEAEKALEKLKAWKRLKDKGFRFEGIKQDYTRFFNQQKPIRIGRKYLQFNKAEDEEWLKENGEDLDLLFGGEE